MWGWILLGALALDNKIEQNKCKCECSCNKAKEIKTPKGKDAWKTLGKKPTWRWKY